MGYESVQATIYITIIVNIYFTTTMFLYSSTFQDGTPTTKTFEHIASEIGAEEAEEVGVEHLLRYTDKLIFLNF